MKKINILLGIAFAITMGANLIYANWDSTTDMQAKTVSSAFSQAQNNFKALDGSSGTSPAEIHIKQNIVFEGTNSGQNSIIFEGTTQDDYELTFTIPEPLSDITISFPSVVQTITVAYKSVSSASTVIPADDSIPQNTEGNQYMSVSITPKYSDSILKIESVALLSGGAGTEMTVALFQDSTANALASTAMYNKDDNILLTIPLTYYMISGTTSSTSFAIRAGQSSAGTTTFNGVAAGRYYGGVAGSYISVTEIRNTTVTNIN